MEKKFGVFIAYHGSYASGGSLKLAEKVYDYLIGKKLNVFLYTKSGNDTYKLNIISAMQSKTFLLVANNSGILVKSVKKIHFMHPYKKEKSRKSAPY